MWIETISAEDATDRLKKVYDRVAGPDGQIDNVLASHSLRPHTLEGHMALYKAVLHHPHNTLPKWFLEVIGTWVSVLNQCAYCVEHHSAGLRRLVNDDVKADAIIEALKTEQVLTGPFDPRQQAALLHAARLTRAPSELTEHDIKALRAAGLDDGEILEINQVTAYFNYANRTVLGLGCTTEGEVLGLSPGNSKDVDDWGHC